MKEVYAGDPFKDVAEWLQSLNGCENYDMPTPPVEAIEITLREALKMQAMGKLSIQCAGWMYHYALQLEERGYKLKNVPMQSVMNQCAKELQLPDLLQALQPDTKPTIITKA